MIVLSTGNFDKLMNSKKNVLIIISIMCLRIINILRINENNAIIRYVKPFDGVNGIIFDACTMIP